MMGENAGSEWWQAMPSRVLEGIGRIKRITLSSDWLEQPTFDDMFSQAWKVSFAQQAAPEVELLFFYRGLPVDPGSVDVFRSLSVLKPALSGPEKLTPNEVSSLRIMMGFEPMFNNQYTNPEAPGLPGGRVFDLIAAQTRRIEDIVVLHLRGRFSSGVQYEGIQFPADYSGRVIQEVAMQAPSAELLARYAFQFNEVIESIQWN